MKATSFISRSSRPPLWREARLGLEAARLLRDPVLRGQGLPDGRGRPALLIPGFLAGDTSLALMGDWLRRGGYRACRTGMRVNADCGGARATRIRRPSARVAREQGQRPTA